MGVPIFTGAGRQQQRGGACRQPTKPPRPAPAFVPFLSSIVVPMFAHARHLPTDVGNASTGLRGPRDAKVGGQAKKILRP